MLKVDGLRLPVNALEIVEVLRYMLEVDGLRLPVDALEIVVVELEKSGECNNEISARGPEPDDVGNTSLSKSKRGKRLEAAELTVNTVRMRRVFMMA
jgi:hypothetical protein